MKGAKVFFNEQTVLNMPFMFRLIRRYWMLVVATFTVITCYTTYKFYFQNTIYSSEKRFRMHQDGMGNPGDAISDLLTVSNRYSTSADIVTVAESRAFHEALAKKIVEHPDFTSLNFKKLNAAAGNYKEEISACGSDRLCKENIIADRISGFISISDAPGQHHTYIFQVRTTDSLTTAAFIDIAVKAFIQNRLEYRKEYTRIQKETTQEVVEDNKKILLESGFRELQTRLEQIKSEQEENRSQFRQTFGIYQQKKLEVESLFELKSASEKKNKQDQNLEDYEINDRIERLRTSIDKLKGDINALELSYNSLSEGDALIIGSLRQELASKVLDYEEITSGRNIGRNVPVLSSDRNIEVEYRVASEQFKRLELEYNMLISNTRLLSRQRNEIESQLESLRATSNLVINLEQRLLQFEVIASTITPDITFFDTSLSIKAFKRMTITKYLLFTFFFSMFFSILAVFTRYLLDERVYDSYELNDVFKDIPIIGNAPKFKKAS